MSKLKTLIAAEAKLSQEYDAVMRLLTQAAQTPVLHISVPVMLGGEEVDEVGITTEDESGDQLVRSRVLDAVQDAAIEIEAQLSEARKKLAAVEALV